MSISTTIKAIQDIMCKDAQPPRETRAGAAADEWIIGRSPVRGQRMPNG